MDRIREIWIEEVIFGIKGRKNVKEEMVENLYFFFIEKKLNIIKFKKCLLDLVLKKLLVFLIRLFLTEIDDKGFIG